MAGMSNAWSGIPRKDSSYREARIIRSNSGIPVRAQSCQHCTPSSRSLSQKSTIDAFSRHQHKNTVQALSWSPNGNFMASASRDQTVRVFDIRAMKELRVLKGHKKEVCCEFPIPPAWELTSISLFSRQPSPGTQCIQSSSRAALKALFFIGTSAAPSLHSHCQPHNPVRRSRRRTIPTYGHSRSIRLVTSLSVRLTTIPLASGLGSAPATRHLCSQAAERNLRKSPT